MRRNNRHTVIARTPWLQLIQQEVLARTLICPWGRGVHRIRLWIGWRTGLIVEMQDSRRSWWTHLAPKFRGSHLSSSSRLELIGSWDRARIQARLKLESTIWMHLVSKRTSMTRAYYKGAQKRRVISKSWEKSQKPVLNRGRRHGVDSIYRRIISLSKCNRFRSQRVVQGRELVPLVEEEEEGHTRFRIRTSWRAWSWTFLIQLPTSRAPCKETSSKWKKECTSVKSQEKIV